MFEAVEMNLSQRPNGCEDHKEWLTTGRSNGGIPEFVALAIPPRTAFFVHQHPGIELVFLVRGSLHEIRLSDPAHIDRHCTALESPFDLKNPDYRFVRNEFKVGAGGRWLTNEVGSIHQTFTEDEECLMVAVWPGRYMTFRDDQLPDGVFEPINHRADKEERDVFLHQGVKPCQHHH